jgi:hypothetical protein
MRTWLFAKFVPANRYFKLKTGSGPIHQLSM